MQTLTLKPKRTYLVLQRAELVTGSQWCHNQSQLECCTGLVFQSRSRLLRKQLSRSRPGEARSGSVLFP